jgi:hypothetical protein
LLHD